jgi:DNA invertase Pin-like site-specific DNA recombinase
MSKNVLELIRVSTEGQAGDDRGGIPAQRAANKRTAEAHGLEIVRTFEIADVSGAKVLACPEMQEILSLIESPEICGVVAREFSRLMRPEDLSDFAILQRFVETRTMLYLPDGPVDLGNKSGRLFGVLRAAMAGYEREEIRERMESGKEAIRRAGRHAGGDNSLPFGVAWDKVKGWSFTPEAEMVKEAFRQVLTTSRPYAQIAAELGLSRTNLRCILQNPIWTGWRVYDKRRDMTSAGYIAGENGRHGYRRKVMRDPADVVRVKVLPELISEAEFQRAQEILADRAARERLVRSQHAPRYTFNGYLACAICGNPLYTHTNRKTGYYICKLNNARARARGLSCSTPYVLAGKVDAKVEMLLCERLQDGSAIRRIAEIHFAEAQEPAGVAGMDVEAAKLLIASLEAKRTRILDAFFDGSISKLEREKRLAAVDRELAGCNGMFTRTAEQKRPRMDAGRLGAILEVFVGFRFLNRDQKRSLLAAARARVFLEGYTVDRLEITSPFDIAHPGKAIDNDSHTGNRLPAAGASPPGRCAETPAARQGTTRHCARAKLLPAAE